MNWNEFDKIKPNIRKSQEYIRIGKDGMITINSSLMKNLESNQLEIYLTKDAKSLGIEEGVNGCVKIPQNGRFRNDDLEEKLFLNKIKLPVYYVGDWEVDTKSKGKCWIAKMTYNHPRKPKRKSNKS